MLESVKRDDSPAGKAQALAFEAYESDAPDVRKKLAQKALNIYPNCADAYSVLADLEEDDDKHLQLLKKALDAGRNHIGEDAFENNKGRFWQLIEARPYMRACKAYAITLTELNREEEAVRLYEEMLELDPLDSQGIRYALMPLYLDYHMNAEARKLHRRFRLDDSACWMYSCLILEFRKGKTRTKAEEILKKAMLCNNYVPDLLLNPVKLQQGLEENPEFYESGDPAEAFYYLLTAVTNFTKSFGLIQWLREQTRTR